jgi:hypothetical protein
LVELFQRWEAHLRETELATGSPAIRFETEDDTLEEAELVRELRELKENMR